MVVKWMRRFAHKGKEDREILALREDICRGLEQGDYASECLAAYYWVCNPNNVRYMRDPTGAEYVKEPIRTVETGAGDCDDIATLLAALLLAMGNRCRFALVSLDHPGQPTHVFVEVATPTGYRALDPVAHENTASMLARVRTKKVVNL